MSEPYEGMWDFEGACAPAEDGSTRQWSGQHTFTLGCFQWVRRGRNGQGKGLKKGRVQYRVKGYVSQPAEAYAAAREYCGRKNGKGVAAE